MGEDYSLQWERIHPGDRVRIGSFGVSHFEKVQSQNRLLWGPKMVQCIGKIGVARTISKEKITVTFFTLGTSNDVIDYNTMYEHTYPWYPGTVLGVKNIYFAEGDRAVLIKDKDMNRRKKVYVQSVSDDSTFSLRTTQGSFITWNQDANENDVIVPIYSGSHMTRLIGEQKIELFPQLDQITYQLASGPNPESLAPDPNLMKIAMQTWAETLDERLFHEVITRHPTLINSTSEGKTPLWRAVELDLWPACAILLSLRADCSVVDVDGNGLLHVAASIGSQKIIEGLLIFSTKYVNRKNLKGETAFHCVALGDNAECINLLLDAPGADPNIQDNDGNTLLHIIAGMQEGSFKLSVLKRLLSQNSVECSLVNNDGYTPLQIAISHNLNRTVEDMVTAKPHLLHEDGKQLLPHLHFAAVHGFPKVLHTLLTSVNVRMITRTKRTALHFAVEKWDNKVEEDKRRMACIQDLVSSGVPLDIPDLTGATPLHLLAANFCDDMIVLPHQLEPLKYMNKSNTRLEQIASSVKPHWPFAVACFLMMHGAELRIVDKLGRTPLDLIKQAHLKNFLRSLSTSNYKPYLPLVSASVQEFNSTNITICAFNCAGNKADITFYPCGHKVVCVQCAKEIQMRRCPLCYQLISSAHDLNEQRIRLGALSAAFENMHQLHLKKVAEEAAEKAEKVMKEKEDVVRELQEKLDQLEMTVNCGICLDRRCTLVFQCGHTSCAECGAANRLLVCHICRQLIESRTVIYS